MILRIWIRNSCQGRIGRSLSVGDLREAQIIFFVSVTSGVLVIFCRSSAFYEQGASNILWMMSFFGGEIVFRFLHRSIQAETTIFLYSNLFNSESMATTKESELGRFEWFSKRSFLPCFELQGRTLTMFNQIFWTLTAKFYFFHEFLRSQALHKSL